MDGSKLKQEGGLSGGAKRARRGERGGQRVAKNERAGDKDKAGERDGEEQERAGAKETAKNNVGKMYGVMGAGAMGILETRKKAE